MICYLTPRIESALKEELKKREISVIRNSEDAIYLKTYQAQKYFFLIDHVFIEDVIKRKYPYNHRNIKDYTLYGKKFDYIIKKGYRWFFVCPECRHLTRILYIHNKTNGIIICCTKCTEKIVQPYINEDKELLDLVKRLITLRRLIKNNKENTKEIEKYAKEYLKILEKIENNPSFRLWKVKKLFFSTS